MAVVTWSAKQMPTVDPACQKRLDTWCNCHGECHYVLLCAVLLSVFHLASRIAYYPQLHIRTYCNQHIAAVFLLMDRWQQHLAAIQAASMNLLGDVIQLQSLMIITRGFPGPNLHEYVPGVKR